MGWIFFLLLLHVLVSILVILRNILLRPREPVTMLAWTLCILLIPVLGLIVYFVLDEERLQRRARRKRRVLRKRKPESIWRNGSGVDRQRIESLAELARLSENLTGIPPTPGNEIRTLSHAEKIYDEIEEAILSARHHVHLEYFSWACDETGTRFANLLAARAREGIEVRVLLDSLGCFSMPWSFFHDLREAGGKVAFFMPISSLRRRWNAHLRNHRKIVIVDGRTAFTGSQNIGDAYRGKDKRFNPWYDTQIRLRGPAVLHLQKVFLEDWYIASQEELDPEVYHPDPESPGKCIVQVLATGPEQDKRGLDLLVFAAIAAARKTIRISSPYFVPPLSHRTALLYAAGRGVTVQVVLPRNSDIRLATWAGRTFFEKLVEAGVEIYELPKAMLHSKIVTIDDDWSLIGSANMDIRSFRLNFEVSAAIYSKEVAKDLNGVLEGYMQEAERVTQKQLESRPLRQKILEGASRMLAPML